MAVKLPEKAALAAKELQKFFVFQPDFPKKGILFWDVFAIFKNKKAFDLLNEVLTGYAEIMKGQVDVVVALEARGFLFGPILANLLNCTFAPIRKKGKLPGQVSQAKYTLEYGEDIIEIQNDSIEAGQRVLLIDDCIATGGTLQAACNLVEKLQGNIVDIVVLYTVPGLNGKDNVTSAITTLLS